MPFLTRLTFTSGDRTVLEKLVGGIKTRAERKGIEFNGPHHHAPDYRSIPQARCLDTTDDRFDPWRYTVYRRTLEIVGHEEFARSMTTGEFPTGVHVEAEIEQVRAAGAN